MSTAEPGQPTRREIRRHGYHSVFWPIILIGVGVMLLLGDMGVIEGVNWWAFLRLWPALLILAGLDLLFARNAPIVGALLGLAVVAGVVVLLIWGGQAGWLNGEPWQIRGVTILGTADVQHDVYSAPLAGQEEAVVELDLGPFRTMVGALSDSANLIEAEIDHVGEMRFEASGTKTAHVILDEESANLGSLSWHLDGGQYRWDIALSPEIPISLVVDASSGRADLQLDKLNVERLTLDASSGAVSASLPASVRDVAYSGSSGHMELSLADETSADVRVEMSSGGLDLTVGEDARVNITVERSSSGGMRLSVPKGTPMRVEVNDSSSGSVRLPQDLKQVKNGEQDEGTWETDDWKADGQGVTLTVDDMSSGSITVEYR